MHAIMSLRVSRGALSDKRELLVVAEAGVFVAAWILAGDRLVLWDNNSRDRLAE